MTPSVETTYEYHYGICQNIQGIATPLAIGITVAITIKLTFSFILALRRKKDGNDKAEKPRSNNS